MALSQGLPVSRLVSVQVALENQAAPVPAINTCLIMGSSPVIGIGERMREYANLNEVAQDFAVTTEEYITAQAWFSQNPRPDNVMIGRWAKENTQGHLICGNMTLAETAINKWKTITAGSFSIQTTGAAYISVGGLNFSAQTTLHGIASVINTRLTALNIPAECRYVGSAPYHFYFSTKVAGAGKTVSFLNPGTQGVSITNQLKGTSALGAHQVIGKAGETAIYAATTLDDMYSSRWYGLVAPGATPNDSLQLAAYCEGCDPPHYYGVTTRDANTLVRTSTTDLAAQLKSFGYHRTAIQYSTTAFPQAIASYLGRILTTQWTGTRTTGTMMYKQEPGVQPQSLSTDRANILQDKHCNVYVAYANDAALVQYGQSSSGEYTDTIIGADALAAAIQGALFNAMFTTATKIPQTDLGMAILTNAVTAACSQFVNNGYLAPGVWNAPGFGQLSTGDLVTLGFYVYAPSLLFQSQADRQARKAPLIQIAAKLAGAIHTVDCVITINA